MFVTVSVEDYIFHYQSPFLEYVNASLQRTDPNFFLEFNATDKDAVRKYCDYRPDSTITGLVQFF